MKMKCWKCGADIPPSEDFRQASRYCPSCCTNAETEHRKILDSYLRLKNIVAHERALRVMEDSGVDMTGYKEPSEIVLGKALNAVDLFASSDEMMAAMVLIEGCVPVKMQKKIGKHRVDFILPDMKVVLEIDGYMHKYSKKEDAIRDVDVRQALGEEWEIVRIPTDIMRKKPDMLIGAIVAIRDERRKARKRNGGALPMGFSRTKDEAIRKVLGKRAEEGA